MVVTPCMYGERVVIHVRLSAGPHPGSKDTYAPPTGFWYRSNAAGGLKIEASPLRVQFLIPVELRT